MKKQNLPVILSALLVGLLLVAYFMKDSLNDFISKKMQESAGTAVVLSGQQWVDSLFNYTRNGKDFEYTLMQFKSTGCTVCRQMEPELERVKTDSGHKVNVTVLNIMNPNSQNLMKYFGISAVPTHLILDKKGTEIFRKYGFVSAQELGLHFQKPLSHLYPLNTLKKARGIFDSNAIFLPETGCTKESCCA